MRWFGKRRRSDDLERELRSDLDLETVEQEEKGLTAEEARYAARRALGNVTRVKEEVRSEWSGIWIETLFQDVRYALRYLRRAPLFTAAAVISLALGIGANAAIFTVINAVLLKSLPVKDPGGLLLLGDARGSGDDVGIPDSGAFALYSYDLYQHLRGAGAFRELAAVQSSEETGVSARFYSWPEAKLVQAKLVSGTYFQVLGVDSTLGRTILPADDSAAAVPVAVISYQYWKGKLGADLRVIGSNVNLGGAGFTIVGVAPAGFFGETLRPDPPDFWVPLSADRLLNRDRSYIDNPDEHWLYVIGRLADGVTKVRAERRLTAVLHDWLRAREGAVAKPALRARIARTYVQLTQAGSGIAHMRREYSGALRLLLGISLAVLIITCANIANLLLARGTARLTETSVRRALGASRARLLRQALTDSLILALGGGCLGLFLASSGTKVLLALFFRGTGYVPIETSPDVRVLVFTFAISCAAAVLFGFAPALRMTSLKATGVSAASPRVKGSRLSHHSLGLGTLLVVAQVALSLVVIAGAGTFSRSLRNLESQQFGFHHEHVLIADIDTTHRAYNMNQLALLYRQMYSRLNAIPEVRSASFSDYSPFNKCCWGFSISIQRYTPGPREELHARLNRISPGYFQTIGTQLFLGRNFDERDIGSSRSVAIVNEEFVRRYFPHENPIGQRFGIGGPSHATNFEIVGVVANAKYESPREETTTMAFLPLLEGIDGKPPSIDDESQFANVIEVRTVGSPEAVSAAIRHALAEIDPSLPVLRVNTLSDDVDLMLNQEKVTSNLALFFGFVALILSCLGVYGLMAYAVQRRTNEIGVRMALGARRASVITMVTRDAVVRGICGIAIGIPAAFGALQLAANQLYGVNPHDLRYPLGAGIILLLSIAVAGFIPALRASRVDPLIALRYE